MLKIIIVSIFTFIGTLTLAQESFTIYLKGQIVGTEKDTIRLLQNKGNKNTLITAIPLDSKGKFSQSISLKDKDYYLLSLEKNRGINLILQQEDTIEIYADGSNFFFSVNIIGSPSSRKMLAFMRRGAVYKNKLDSANTYLKAHQKEKAQVQQAFHPIYTSFVSSRQQFIKENSDNPAVIAAISTLNLQREWEVYKNIVNSLQESFPDSPTTKRIVKEFKKNDKIRKSHIPIPIGSMAKDIALPTPAGDTLQLSDYRGHVVLLDFWASWCGPCRRENPNVVKAYNKYKDRGFIVFSVSLDRSKGAWKKAIQEDGLIWNTHVSDLKYWSSAPAKKYRVSSIPMSFLINEKGEIIAKNLRGVHLEKKLSQLYGTEE